MTIGLLELLFCSMIVLVCFMNRFCFYCLVLSFFHLICCFKAFFYLYIFLLFLLLLLIYIYFLRRIISYFFYLKCTCKIVFKLNCINIANIFNLSFYFFVNHFIYRNNLLTIIYIFIIAIVI